MAFKMKGWSAFNKEKNYLDDKKNPVDPDAPGTPGQPGYEPPVEYDELDEKGKKLYKSLRRGRIKKNE